VTVSGIVTGDFQDDDADDANELGGFYVQQATPDADPMTSDGIFVFDGNSPATNVSIGDHVTVQGTVNEYFGETQITAPTVAIIGSGTIRATAVTLPADGTTTNSDGKLIVDFERYEGMLLHFPQTLSISDLHDLERFGAIGLSQGGRLYQFTNANTPDPATYSAYKASNARRSFELDDGRRSRNPSPIRFLNAGSVNGYSIRAGDTVTGAARLLVVVCGLPASTRSIFSRRWTRARTFAGHTEMAIAAVQTTPKNWIGSSRKSPQHWH
jgi:predicted extracellular nuclease